MFAYDSAEQQAKIGLTWVNFQCLLRKIAKKSRALVICSEVVLLKLQLTRERVIEDENCSLSGGSFLQMGEVTMHAS